MNAPADVDRATQVLAEDRAKAIATFLREVQLLPGTGSDTTDPTKRQFEDFKLEISKGVGKLVTGAGGIGALLAASGTVLGAFREQVGDGITIGLILSGAALIAASIVGLALILRADVSGRAAVATQVVEERGVVVSALLTLLETVDEPGSKASSKAADSSKEGPQADAAKAAVERNEARVLFGLATYGEELEITTSLGTFGTKGLRSEGDTLQVLQSDGDWVDVADVTSFSAKSRTSR